MAVPPDPNINAYRPDLAAAALRGVVEAARFVEGDRFQAARGTVPLRERPDADSRQVSELLMGEGFLVYEQAAGWAWGQSTVDDYVGYAPLDRLSAPPVAATHRIGALRALVFPAADLKTPPLDSFSLGSRVAIVGEEGRYSRLAAGGWVATVALAALDAVAADPVATALRFLGVPYLWGGRSALGIDCSGLVQVALAEAGIRCPRDSYMQEEAVGAVAPLDGPYRRGDLVTFPGHCGLMVDETNLVHANATEMWVSVDPLARVVEIVRGQSDGRGITAVRRIGG
ncbi:MAG: C40 family peptidase [Inquilinus sp.]|nr:C40 family peptidase [Inquilinus sp.]